jgi:hypothetical protein
MRLWERVKAWRRKEHMVKGVNRGRCFVKKDSESTGGAKQATAKAESKLVEIKVIRADGTEEVIKHG